MRRLLPFALTLTAGCWSTPEPVDFATIPYETSVSDVNTAVVRTLRTALRCPDGQAARYYIIYDETVTAPAPVAIVLHSASFDYLYDPRPDDPIFGQHFAGASAEGVTQLEWTWGVQKTWETMGMHPRVDPSEVNNGTLVAALLEKGFTVLMPMNCWGDLWHNESGYINNDTSFEFFERNGGALSWRMLQMLHDEYTADSYGLPDDVPIDPDQVYLVGLGDGGRGVIDLLKRMYEYDEGDIVPWESVKGILLDSAIEDLEHWARNVDDVEDGLNRIFYDPSATSETVLSQWSLRRLYNQGVGPKWPLNSTPIAYIYSSSDPKVPNGNHDALLNVMTNGVDGDNKPRADKYCIINTKDAAHVFTNADIILAREAVEYILTGEPSKKCTESAG
ncbi:MAG: hypothetical protein IPO67_21815 [Deltaproteobacteria bacterium]|nr:hypothetical protein [Deltaproteobacteria bacterium]